MASGDARPVPRKGVLFRVTFPVLDADGDLVTAAAGLDSEISKDGGAFADCTNEATEIATSSGMYYLDLTATEMDADTVVVIVKTTTLKAKTTPIVLYPEEIGDYRADVPQVDGAALGTHGVGQFPSDVRQVDGVALGTHGAGQLPSDVRQVDGAALGTHGAGQFPSDVRQVDGAVLGTHGAGQLPSDVRQWVGGAPNPLIAGRVDANAQVVGDKTGYQLAADQAVNTTKWVGTAVDAPLLLDTKQAIPGDVRGWRGSVPNALIAGRVDANAQVVADKTGYELAADQPVNTTKWVGTAVDAPLLLDTKQAIPGDVRGWRGGVPNALIAGRVDANAQVVGDKTGYSLAADQPVNTTKWAGTTVDAPVLLDGKQTIPGDVRGWRGSVPNAMIAGRVDANAQVVGDKTGYTLAAGSYSARASSSQRGTASLPDGGSTLSVDLSISSVTTSRASQATSHRDQDAMASQISSSTTIQFTRDNAIGATFAATEVWELL